MTAAPVVGGYPLVSVLGAGGFGTVYLGTSPWTGEPVAVKVLDRPGEQWRRDLMRSEAAALARVDDPHCVRVLDVVDEPDVAAIVTEYVEGASLRAVLDNTGRLDGPQALGVLRGALEGLAAVHAAGLVHGDLKPANILVDRHGRSRLIDFGLAAPPRWLAPGQGWIGSPAYLSPEQVSGSHVDGRSDLYAAGVMLFELLTGQKPFTAADPDATASLHLSAPPPDPRQLVPGLTVELAALCLQSLAKHPDERMQSAAAFLRALDYAASEQYGHGWAVQSTVGLTVGAVLAAAPAGSGLLGAPAAVGGIVGGGLAGAGAGAGVGAGAGGVAAGAAGGSSGGLGAAAAGATVTTKSALAVAAVTTGLAAGVGGVTVVMADDDERQRPAPPPYVPAIVAAYSHETGDQASAGEAHVQARVVRNDGTTLRIRGIDLAAGGGGAGIPQVLLGASPDGRYVAAADADSMTVVDAADPSRQRQLDCDCLGISFDDDGSLVTLTHDYTLDTYSVSADAVEVAGSVPLAGAPRTDRSNPQRFYASDLLEVAGGRAYLVLPGGLTGGYLRTHLVGADVATGSAETIADLSVAYSGAHALSDDGRHLAFEATEGDGCATSRLAVVDLAAGGTAGGAGPLTWVEAPDRYPDDELPAGGTIGSVELRGGRVVTHWAAGPYCDQGDPMQAFAAPVDALAAGDGPTAWAPAGEELGMTWQATAHDGRSLSTWTSTYFEELWLGDPAARGTRVASQVHDVVAVGEPGVPPPARRVRGTEQIEVHPWLPDGSLEPGYRVEDVASSYVIDCSYDTGSPVSRAPGTHACGSTADNTFACWNDPSSSRHMLCLPDPWERDIRRVRVRNLDPGTPAPADPSPFGLELADGSQCFFRIGGAWGMTPGDTFPVYGCDGWDGQSWFVLASPSRETFEVDGGTWTVLVSRSDTRHPERETPREMEVKRLWWLAGQ